ncbi:MAG: hypothetical protein J1F02_04095 [Lachnospiraceae bacterium]|nr:hypothetical protein [Lachnospiraceae bacterium]
MEKIEEKLFKVLVEKFGLKSSICNSENINKPLTGKNFNLSAVELAYFLLEIEKEYSIQFAVEETENYGVSTIKKIAYLIYTKQKKDIF